MITHSTMIGAVCCSLPYVQLEQVVLYWIGGSLALWFCVRALLNLLTDGEMFYAYYRDANPLGVYQYGLDMSYDREHRAFALQIAFAIHVYTFVIGVAR